MNPQTKADDKKSTKYRIMVVDDEEFCISAIQSMLSLLNIDKKYHIDFCIDGVESVNKLVETYNNNS